MKKTRTNQRARHDRKLIRAMKLCMLFFLIGTSIGWGNLSYAQRPDQMHRLSGRVVDSKGEPIIGANIVEAGTTNGTVTDVNGHFTLNVGSNATIRVSYIGCIAQDLPIEGKSNVEITLQEDTQVLGEVVAIGYGTMKKSDLKIGRAHV